MLNYRYDSLKIRLNYQSYTTAHQTTMTFLFETRLLAAKQKICLTSSVSLKQNVIEHTQPYNIFI